VALALSVTQAMRRSIRRIACRGGA
jgi:hypothetical protein